jgi:hypothetical protein
MSECFPALSPAELSRRLKPLDLTSRDTRTLLRDPDFQAIPDRNSQVAFLADFIPEQCYDTVNNTRLSAIYEISVGTVRKIRCSQRKRNQTGLSQTGRPFVQAEEQENQPLQSLLTPAFLDDSLILINRELAHGGNSRRGESILMSIEKLT